MIKSCLRCSKEFYTKPARIKGGRGKYCSVYCASISRQGKPAWNSQNITRSCLICAKIFRINPARLKKAEVKYCSESCFGISQIGSSKHTQKHTDKTKLLISQKKKGIPSGLKGKEAPWLTGNKNGMWKDDKVGYWALHDWVYRWKGRPSKCEHCGAIKKLQWANKSQQYKRDLEDWLSLCVRCHIRYDKQAKLTCK